MHYHRLCLLLCTTLALLFSTLASADELSLEQVRRVFPDAHTITPLNGKAPAYSVRSERAQLGYAFASIDLAPISAYSGKPINTLVALGEDGDN